MSLVGIDEAGRGPVIGPLVIAGVKVEDDSVFENLDVRDSKVLSPLQRELRFDRIREAVQAYKIVIIQPSEIDNAVASEHSNLNWLEADKSAEILNLLRPAKAILDCPSNNTAAYAVYVRKKLTQKMELVVEHKADANYKVVSAASILAKVTRDREIANIRKEIGINFGSGYPSDPLTQLFLRKYHGKFPGIFRKTWSSYQRHIPN